MCTAVALLSTKEWTQKSKLTINEECGPTDRQTGEKKQQEKFFIYNKYNETSINNNNPADIMESRLAHSNSERLLPEDKRERQMMMGTDLGRIRTARMFQCFCAALHRVNIGRESKFDRRRKLESL